MKNFQTPWGITQSIKPLYLTAKIYKVTTSGHGGVMIHKSETNNFSDACILRGIKFEDYYCYEEDCDASIPLYEIHNKLNQNVTEGINYYNWVSQFHPDYLIEQNIEPKPQDYRNWVDQQFSEINREQNMFRIIMNKDPRVAEIINNSIKAGNAKIEIRDGQWYYIDPHFGEDTPLDYLNYTDELGLHVMVLARNYHHEYR